MCMDRTPRSRPASPVQCAREASTADPYDYAFVVRQRSCLLCMRSGRQHWNAVPSEQLNLVQGFVKTCPAGWVDLTPYGCYYIHRQKQKWIAARDNCISRGGYLISIETEGESTAIIQYLESDTKGTQLWIGGNDRDEEDTWVWVGTHELVNLTFMNWEEHNPVNDAPHRNCAFMKFESGYKWQDGRCVKKKPSMCEYP